MTVIADLTTATSAPFRPTALPAASGVSFEAFHDLAAVEPLWRTMEAEGVGSPYQRFDWVRAYIEALAAHETFEPRIVLLRDAADRPLLLLPLAVRRRYGFRIASLIGGKQANYHLPLMGLHASTPSADCLGSVLVAVGRRLGIDAYDFTNLPRTWQGRPNPLVLPGARPNPSDSHVLTLGRDAEGTLKRVLDKDARKEIRQKERYLTALGPVVHRVARTPAEVDRILDAYVAHKIARFRALGLSADIERAPMRAFIRQGCLAGLDAGRPAIELHAMEVGERIAAVFGAAVDRQRASGMFISFDGAPDLARCSPGDLLVARVIAAQCERGRAAFDLGVGEARYKSAFCPETDPLFALTLPVTARGRAGAAMLRAAVSAKRFVKRTPWAWRAVGAVRAAQAKVGTRSNEA